MYCSGVAPAHLHLVQGEPRDGGPGDVDPLPLALPQTLGPQHRGGQEHGLGEVHLQGEQQGKLELEFNYVKPHELKMS